ncbi:class I SAM-dependent methyltransferase [Haloactinopolyspora sp.]|uniref:class I SAM-dependent methyltransferase n=1 Tax=Haloactinopolyspora sp. TaxID=1966353 RepID=UPI002621B5C6|nr:class I SAM-dependent methyltransferase [Haloactinopolyspora sp.]
MLRAVRSFLGSRWPALGMLGAFVAGVVAVWTLVDETRVTSAALAGLLGLALVGLVVVSFIARSAEHRARSIEARLNKVESVARETSATVGAIKKAQADPSGGRLGAIIGAQRLDAAVRHDELVNSIGQLRSEVTDQLRKVNKDLAAGFREAWINSETQLSELSALANLYAIFDPQGEVPVLGGFAASPQTILRLTSLAMELPDDGLIVECGSGASTVWLSFACRRAGHGRVVALEHDERYAELTREALARHDLSSFAEVRIAPLEPFTLGEESYDWYSRKQWDDLEGIDLLFVDGPPGSVGPRSRYPAYPLLARALSEGAVVALDDIHRDAEARIGADWLNETVSGVTLRDGGKLGRTRLLTATRSAAAEES